MPKSLIAIKGAGCVLAIALLGMSMQPRVASALEVSDGLRADILTLLHVSGADSLAMQIGTYVSNALIDVVRKQYPDAPDSVVAAIKDEVAKVFAEEMPGMRELVIPVYARHYSQAEIQAFIAFFETPAGSKFVREAPLVLKEATKAGEDWGKTLEPKFAKRIEARLESTGDTSR